jgi:two-component system, chemotaxis family, chemotaxis protein CheY
MSAKVLIVEDNADSREMLSFILRYEGYKVVTASDGSEGISQVKNARPDLIISDLEMPNLDGIEMVKTLRHLPEAERVPILILSAYDSESLDQAIQEGATQAMRKPFEVDSLVETVKGLLN